MNNFTININATELVDAINSLADLLAAMPHMLHREVAEEAKAQLAKEVKPEPEQLEAPAKTDLTIEEVRAAFLAKNSKTNTAKLKAILDKYEVDKVTSLDPKDFDAVMKDLDEL